MYLVTTLKKEAVQLIVDKGYSLREAFEALGVSQNSLSNWRKKFIMVLQVATLKKRIAVSVKKSIVLMRSGKS